MPEDSKTAETQSGQTGPEVEKTGRLGPISRGAATGGGLTHETGNLTGTAEPDSIEPFVPAETREYSDPLMRGHVTEASKNASELHRRQLEESSPRGVEAEGSAGAISEAGQLTTERATGLTGLQGQNQAMGSTTSAEAGTLQGAGATELASREGGYGTTRGLSRSDPAYAMDDRTLGEDEP